MDSSSSVQQLNYQKEKEFVKKLSKYLNVKPSASRVAFITYGDQSRTAFKYDDYQSVLQMEAQIDGAPYIGGERRMDKAMRSAQAVLTASRPLVPRIVILLTAGPQSFTASNDLLENAAKALHDIDAKTYVIAIGAEPDKNELLKTIDRPQNLIPMNSFNKLGSSAPSIAKDISSSSGKPTYMIAYSLL